eukprot:CAMPEP_0198616052 /NCGR_PEP_ID=MMETSP1462-20131121/159702_1 /TAXON_ID=1333877 /ORGANISM="Brandtodinium nutriculum, Strain RCC3387" /LENGTH=202 /DNA_ID=CAMNT_0044347853 /DNA_START=170 /DNA_END=776 /DNA_ORIENTATION=+
MRPHQLRPNLAISALVDELQVRCAEKCGWVGQWSDRRAHGLECPVRLLREADAKLSVERRGEAASAQARAEAFAAQQALVLAEQASNEMRAALEQAQLDAERQRKSFAEAHRADVTRLTVMLDQERDVRETLQSDVRILQLALDEQCRLAKLRAARDQDEAMATCAAVRATRKRKAEHPPGPIQIFVKSYAGRTLTRTVLPA